MSLLLIPRYQAPSQFIVMSNLTEADATDQMDVINFRLRDKARADEVRLVDRGEAPGSFQSFDVPAVQGNVAAIALAEKRLADLLKVSRTPRASGNRGVFVDLATGRVLVGTTVFFNERQVSSGVLDASLEHKVAFVAGVLGLTNLDAEPGDVRATFTLSIDGPGARAALNDVTVKIDGESYLLGTLIDAAEEAAAD